MKKLDKEHLETVRTLLSYLGEREPDPKTGAAGMGGVTVKKTIAIECPNYACDCTMVIELPSEEYKFSHSYSNYELEKAVYELKKNNEDPDDNP